jgi:LysM repeat protein
MTPQGGSVINSLPTIATTEAPPPTAIALAASPSPAVNLSPTTAQLVFATATLSPSPTDLQPTTAPISFVTATDIPSVTPTGTVGALFVTNTPPVSATPTVTNTQVVIIVTATPIPVTDTPVIIIVTATPSITLTPSITNTPTATPTEPHIITPVRTQPAAVAQAATQAPMFNADAATQTQQAVFGSATAILDTATAGANQQLTLIATLQGTGIPVGGVVAPTAVPAPGQPAVVPPSSGQGLMITFTPTPLPSINNAAVSGAMGPISNDCIYVVQAGDRLFRIALRFNLTPYQIAYANNLINQDYLSPEQKLRIPGCAIPTPAPASVQSLPTATISPIVSPVPVGGPAAGSSSGKTYSVVDGDTMYSIATRFGVRVIALAQVNNIANISLIYIGQVLIIP